MAASSERVSVASFSTAMTKSRCSSHRQEQLGRGLGTLTDTWPPEEAGNV